MGPPDVVPDETAQEDWGATLREVVTAKGYVDYDRLEQRRDTLDAYVAWLADPINWEGKLTRDWHARYLNAYNALVLYQVLERDRPASVQEPRRLIPMDGAAFFLETQFKLGHDWLSLSEIEHERVRQRELDYRDHAALNCASRSCPPMRNELYKARGDLLRLQLDQQMARWVMDNERGVHFEDDVVVFSPIFDWFAGDFQFLSAGLDLCTLTSQFARGKKRKRLEQAAVEGCKHRFGDYDWSLNHASVDEQ